MHPAVLLTTCLVVACSGKRNDGNGHNPDPANTDTNKSLNSHISTTNPPPPVSPTRRGYDPPRLYVNDRGVHFEIFELDDLPYDGKVVTYHDGEQKIIATEKVFEKGRLNTEREYWPNAKPKLEIIYNLGNTTTNRYDQLGNEIKPPPPTRSYNWTYNYKGGKAHLETFIGRDLGFLTKYLGEPNIKLNNTWTYRNMRIFDGQTGQQHTAVRFTILGNTVSSVALLQ